MVAIFAVGVNFTIFNITEQNKSFSVVTLRYSDILILQKLKEVIERRKSNQIKLHVGEVTKRRLELTKRWFKYSSFIKRPKIFIKYYLNQ